MTEEASICLECGAPLPAGAERGVCPRCALVHAMALDAPAQAPKEGLHPGIHLVLPDGTTAPLPFQELGDYELIEEIGSGGMGVIYKARQRSLDRIVALKLIRAGSLARAGDVARFRTEAAAAGRLQHPHIVTIYEVGELQGQCFYSMEFVAGQSLARELRRRSFAPREAARVLQAIAEAIHFAHQRGILHRDLKPSNILLDADGQPKVADFGLAKILQSDSELTLSGAVMGSPHYMPPEQASGRSAEAGVRSDVYSLGAIFYEMLAGRPPFNASTPLETMKLVVEQEPVAPRALNPNLPADLETICLKCIAKEPGGRYATAGELAEELGRFLRDEPIRARPAGALERGWRWCRRKPALATLGAVLLLAPLVVMWILLSSRAKVLRERNRAQLEEQITRVNLYADDVALAARALASDDYDTAWRALEAAIPSPATNHADNPSTNDLRGFEWRWLWQRVQGDARKSFPAHLGVVNAVAYSADGRYMASASMDGMVKIWDAQREECLRTITDPDNPSRAKVYSDQSYEHDSQVHSAGFTADGRRLVIGSGYNVGLWNPDDGTRFWVYTSNLLGSAICSPADPELALAICDYPRTNAVLLSLSTGQPARRFSGMRFDAACFSHDGRRLARWDREARRLYVMTLLDGKTEASMATPGMYVMQMAFLPDGATIACADFRRGNIDFFDIASQKRTEELPGDGGPIRCMAISPDGRYLAAGGYSQAIRLWDLARRREVRELRGHRKMITALAFSPDSRRLASGGYDGTVRFWDVYPPPPPAAITNVFGTFAFSSDGRLLVTEDGYGTARFWSLPERRLVREWSTPTFQGAAFTTGGMLLLSSRGDASQPPSLRKYSVQTGENAGLIELSGVASPCSITALSADGRQAATGHKDGSVVVWDTSTGKACFKKEHALQFSNRFLEVDALRFSGDGRRLAAGSFSAVSILFLDAVDGRVLAKRHFGANYPLMLAVSPDGREIATAGNDQGLSLNLWDETLTSRITSLRGYMDVPNCAAFSTDGRTLATADVNGQLKLWHMATRREEATVHSSALGISFKFVDFSPDGSWLGASDTMGLLRLFHGPNPDPKSSPPTD